MTTRAEEALATWDRIMEKPRAHTRDAILTALSAVVGHLPQEPSEWIPQVLRNAEFSGAVPPGTAALWSLAHRSGADLCKLLGLDPWLLDTPTTPEAEAAAFNERYPVGTLVRYWPGEREGDGLQASTQSTAFVTARRCASVWIDSDHAIAPLSHVEPVQ